MCCFIIELKTGMIIIAVITIIVAIGGLIDAINTLFWYGGDGNNGGYDNGPLYGIVCCLFLIP